MANSALLFKVLSLILLTVDGQQLQCDHITYDGCAFDACVSMVHAAGVCTKEVEYNELGNLVTKYEKSVCVNGALFIREYSNDDCTGIYTSSYNMAQLLESELTNDTFAALQTPITCDTRRICPYVKIREFAETSATDCSSSAIIPLKNEEYSDNIHVLNECTSMTIPDYGNVSMKYECENDIVTQSFWMNLNCDGVAAMSTTGNVGNYLGECEVNDRKQVIVECVAESAYKLSPIEIPISININIEEQLQCDHVQFDGCEFDMCLSMVHAAGVCTEEVVYDDFGNLETIYEQSVCENGELYFRNYSNNECNEPYESSMNFIDKMELEFAESNMTGDLMNMPIECDTGKICPYVKIREWTETSATDCSLYAGIIPKDNEEYSDNIHIINECTSMQNTDVGDVSIAYQCENNIVTQSIWMNLNCNGDVAVSKQGYVGSYLGECQVFDTKQVIIECVGGNDDGANQFKINSICWILLLFTFFFTF
eukprot:69332_1